MYKLYADSVRASYTARELAELLQEAGLTAAWVFLHARTHLAARGRNGLSCGGRVSAL